MLFVTFLITTIVSQSKILQILSLALRGRWTKSIGISRVGEFELIECTEGKLKERVVYSKASCIRKRF